MSAGFHPTPLERLDIIHAFLCGIMLTTSNPKRDIAASKKLIENPLDFEGWAKQNKMLKELLDF